MPGSVMMVAGLELTSTILYPAALRALHALRARVVEFAGLPDDDGSGSDDQHLIDPSILGSSFVSPPEWWGLLQDSSKSRRGLSRTPTKK